MATHPAHHRLVHAIAANPAFARRAPTLTPKLDRLVYRLTGGRFMASSGFLPVILLTATGARSGELRTVPLAAMPDGDDLIVVASNFGQLHHPAWSANLLAHPEAHVERSGERFAVTAERVSDEEKAELWPHLLEVWPLFDRYAETSQRNIRVFRLRRAPRTVM